MEMSQGKSLYNYLKQIKMSFLFLQSPRTRGQNRSCLEGWYQWEKGGSEERVYVGGEYGANILYTGM
jgi:hypothetical protein